MIDGAILWPNTRVERDAHVGGVIAAEHCHFGRNTQIATGIFGDKTTITDYSRT